MAKSSFGCRKSASSDSYRSRSPPCLPSALSNVSQDFTIAILSKMTTRRGAGSCVKDSECGMRRRRLGHRLLEQVEPSLCSKLFRPVSDAKSSNRSEQVADRLGWAGCQLRPTPTSASSVTSTRSSLPVAALTHVQPHPDIALRTHGCSGDLQTGKVVVPHHRRHQDRRPSSTSMKFRHLSTTVLWLLMLLLLFLLHASPSQASPLYQDRLSHFRQQQRNRHMPKPKWINPCGINHNKARRIMTEVTPMSDQDLLSNVIRAARVALRHSANFKEDYVKKTFRVKNWWDHKSQWADHPSPGWLPSLEDIPKKLHQRTSKQHLQTLELDQSLYSTYTYLQKLAVGLEQVVLDQMVNKASFVEEFNEAEFRLKEVLCEVQAAMMEKGIDHQTSIHRDIMPMEERHMQVDSYRNMRDWFIFRDYMNSLEYVVQSFDHLRRH